MDQSLKDEFSRSYLQCALWSSTDDKDRPLDAGNYDLAPDARTSMIADCDRFQSENRSSYISAMSDAQAGHDFWLTRNGHGAGFWDRDLGALGDALTIKAKAFGTCDLYVGDDNLIYSF